MRNEWLFAEGNNTRILKRKWIIWRPRNQRLSRERINIKIRNPRAKGTKDYEHLPENR